MPHFQLESKVDKAKVADTCPKQVELEAGKKYAYCTCGLSDSQPFCNGAHKGTAFTPVVFTCEESKTSHLCQCKQTGNKPYCDGSHSNLGDAGNAKPSLDLVHPAEDQGEGGGCCGGSGDGSGGG